MLVPRETRARLRHLAVLIMLENEHQNLVSKSSIDSFLTRHVFDSIQLLPLLASGPMVDVGSGAGLPGLVLACCRSTATTLIEPRRRRADFLARTAGELGLDHVSVVRDRVERVALDAVATITARAVMPLADLLAATLHLATPTTRWVLPKGRRVESELATARLSWHGRFDLVASRTDPDARIVVVEGVKRRRAE